MIEVHKLNGHAIVVNAELIECLEGDKETVISLATGNRYVVRESTSEITRLVVEYRGKIASHGKVVNPIHGFERKQA